MRRAKGKEQGYLSCPNKYYPNHPTTNHQTPKQNPETRHLFDFNTVSEIERGGETRGDSQNPLGLAWSLGSM